MEPIKIMQSFVITSYFITFTFSYEGIAYLEQCMAGTLGNNQEHGHFYITGVVATFVNERSRPPGPE